MIRRRAFWSVAALVVLASGCGASGTIAAVGVQSPVSEAESVAPSAPSPPSGGRMSVSRLRQATESAAAATSGRFEMTIRSSGGTDGDMSMTTTGAYSGDRSQFSTTIAASGVADETIPGLGPVNDLMDNELITVGQETYVRGGVFGILGGEQNPGETGWLRIPGAVIDASELQMVSPDQLSELLDGAFGDVTDLGAADVRGAATTRYQVALDIDRILGADVTTMAPGDLSASGNLTIDVYVDAEGVARRVTFAPTLEGTTFEVAADYFDLGAEIDIQPPTDFAELDAETLFGGLGKVLDDAFQDLNSAD